MIAKTIDIVLITGDRVFAENVRTLINGNDYNLIYLNSFDKFSVRLLPEQSGIIIIDTVLFENQEFFGIESSSLLPVLLICNEDDRISDLKDRCNCLFSCMLKSSVPSELETVLKQILPIDCEKLREDEISLSQYRAALRTMQLGVTITDMEKKIEYVNPADAEMHGYSVDELIGKDSRIFSPKKASVPVKNMDLERWTRESYNIRKDGSLFPVELTSDVICNDSGEPVGIITTSRDITERKAKDSRLRKLLHAAEQSPAMVIMTDIKGDIEYVNPRFTEVTGFSSKEAIGENPRVLKSGAQGEEFYENLWKTISTGHIWQGEFHNKKKNGELYWGHAIISGVKDKEGVIQSYIGIQQDVTDKKEMELELKEKNKELEHLNRLKGEFVAVTSHDLKSPLNAMVSYANLIKEFLPEDSSEKITLYLDRIVESGGKLRKFINEILDMERIESGRLTIHPENTYYDDLLKSCVEINAVSAQDKNIKITFLSEEEQILAFIDKMMMEQVFNNLLSNAVKFSPQDSEIEVLYRKENNKHIVTVKDCGPGIPEADLKNIFSKFFQVKKNGLIPERAFGVGLGLFITKSIVSLHNGTIYVENNSGVGCRFIVEIPVKNRKDKKDVFNVMIIDSDRIISRYLEPALRRKKIAYNIYLSIENIGFDCKEKQPDLIFVHNVDRSDKLTDVLNSDYCHARVVNLVDNERDISAKVPFKNLVCPLTDLEIYQLINETVENSSERKE